MQKQRFVGLKCLYFLLPNLMLLTLVACGTSSTAQASNSPLSSNAPGKASQIVIQIFSAPGFIFPSVNGVPEWTLYSNGLLLFRPDTISTPDSGLLEAHLSDSAVNHLLDKINQYHFFTGTRQTYGQIIPDTGMTLLSVTANSKHRVVALSNNQGPDADAQTHDVFMLVQFLKGYQPVGAQTYNPPGVALLVISTQAIATTSWPYHDISLTQIAASECPLLMPNNPCPAPSAQAKVSILTGPRGIYLLQRANAEIASQNGEAFQIFVWPLMPDILNSPPTVWVAQADNLQEWSASQLGN